MTLSNIMSLVLVVRRIETGARVDFNLEDHQAALHLVKEALVGDPALAQKILRFAVGVPDAVREGIEHAVMHEIQDPSCEACGPKLDASRDALRQMLTAERAAAHMDAIVAATEQALAAHGGDVKAAAEALSKQIEKGSIEERGEVPGHVPFNQSKKTEYLN